MVKNTIGVVMSNIKSIEKTVINDEPFHDEIPSQVAPRRERVFWPKQTSNAFIGILGVLPLKDDSCKGKVSIQPKKSAKHEQLNDWICLMVMYATNAIT